MYVYVPAEYRKHLRGIFLFFICAMGVVIMKSSWVKDGRAAVILDNLIAADKARPMLVVMSNGLTDGSWAGGSTVEGMNTLEEELFTDIIPMIECNYRVAKIRRSM